MRIASFLLALAATAIHGPAAAQDAPANWLKKPTAWDLMAVWPAKALKDGNGGRAVISCIVSLQGALRSCRVESETPVGAGFGGAALALAPQLLMTPARKNGQPVVSSVNIPITFPAPDKATGSHIRPATDDGFRRDRLIAKMPWKQAPSYAETLAAYPAKARTEKKAGFAALDCNITRAGGLSGCNIIREEPRGYGFGQAARSLATRFVGPATDSAGQSLERARTQVSFTFAPEALGATSPIIGRPNWTSIPQVGDLAAVIPAQARKAGVFKARVVMSCTVGPTGSLEACEAQSEDPAGLGYAGAALALARTFRLAVWSDEGLPTIGGTVRVPIRFDFDDVAKP